MDFFQGGFAKVYELKDMNNGEVVAGKIVAKTLLQVWSLYTILRDSPRKGFFFTSLQHLRARREKSQVLFLVLSEKIEYSVSDHTWCPCL